MVAIAYAFHHTFMCVLSLKLQVSFAKEPYKRDYILQKRPIISRSLLMVAIAYALHHTFMCVLSLMRWLPSVASLKLYVSFAEYRLFHRAF